MRAGSKLLSAASQSLKVANAEIREAVLKGVPATGPPSILSPRNRAHYVKTPMLDQAFEQAKSILAKESERQKARAQELEAEVLKESDPAKQQELKKAQFEALVQSELRNPEVQYNFNFDKDSVDLKVPVYNHLARKEWEKREMLVLMQRVEQHHMIPDTLPTFEPKAELKLRFLTPNAKWLEAGDKVDNAICSRRPELLWHDWEKIADPTARYTVVFVNPDIPELETDSFRTVVHYAVCDLKLSDSKAPLDWSTGRELTPWVPPVPEKNSGYQRVCVWLFRQPSEVTTKEISDNMHNDSADFDIREFAATNNLEAVSAHLWRVNYSLGVTDELREKHGLPEGQVYFRARTMKPEEALSHFTHREKWEKFIQQPEIVIEKEAAKK